MSCGWNVTEYFYVYTHTRPDTREVFYVGKGTFTAKRQYKRAHSRERRGPHWRRIVTKAGAPIVEIVAVTVREALAFAIERAFIALYRRTCDGGTLCNVTLGGEGTAGHSPSETTRAKMSMAATGKRRTAAQRMAVSLAQRGVPNHPEQNRRHSLRMTGNGNPWFGKKQPPEMGAKKAASMRGKLAGSRHPFWGKRRSERVRLRLSAVNSRAVRDRLTGESFASARAAALARGVSETALSRWLRGLRANPTSLEFA